MPIVEDPTN